MQTIDDIYEQDRDMNSVDFIYWYNGSGMVEFQMERGMVDKVVPRGEMREVLSSILRTLMMGRSQYLPAA